MFFIDTNFESPCNDPICNIFEEIDLQIYEIGKVLLNKIRYNTKANVNYDKYELLKNYRDILETLIYCSDTLCDVNMAVVISQIRKLTNTNC